MRLVWSTRALVVAVFSAAAPVAVMAGGGHHADNGDDGRMIEPARTEFVREPAVVGTRVQRIETRPGYWSATQMPAQHGYVDRSVIVQPAAVRYKVVAARYQTVRETVVIQPAGVRYEMRPDAHGRMVRREVLVPAVTRAVSRRVMVAPAHTMAMPEPAVYRTVRVPLHLAPAKVSYQYTPPHVDYVAHKYTWKAPTVRAIHHPARYAARRVYHDADEGRGHAVRAYRAPAPRHVALAPDPYRPPVRRYWQASDRQWFKPDWQRSMPQRAHYGHAKLSK